jgi:hypothetical protein
MIEKDLRGIVVLKHKAELTKKYQLNLEKEKNIKRREKIAKTLIKKLS